MVDVQILEVSRERAKTTAWISAAIQRRWRFSPERAPGDGGGKAFNLNTISQGISTADFYLSVPAAVIRFPGDRFTDEGAGQAELARRRRTEAVAEPR
jgi:hypothetical protein